MFFRKKQPHEGLCLALHLFVAGLLLFTSAAAFIGVFKAHVQPEGLEFGTTVGSLSLLALAVSLVLWLKSMKDCACGCEVCGTKKK